MDRLEGGGRDRGDRERRVSCRCLRPRSPRESRRSRFMGGERDKLRSLLECLRSSWRLRWRGSGDALIDLLSLCTFRRSIRGLLERRFSYCLALASSFIR